MPFKSGLRSGVRGPAYAEGVCGAAAARGGAAPRCARATPTAAPKASAATVVATPMAAIGFFILIRGESTSRRCLRGTDS